MTPDRHVQTKRLVAPPFSPQELASFESDIRTVASDIVDEVAPKGQCEFVFDVASKLPVFTFCRLMGAPDHMRDTLMRLGNAIADIETENPRRLEQRMELFAIAGQLADEKRAHPDKYLLSRLVHGEVDGQKLDDMSIGMFVVTLSIAGHETTRNTAAHFLRLMNEHPDQFELLRSDPDRYLPNAIEEVLRFAPPVMQFRRTATEDTKIGDKAVAKGDKIYLSYPAANRDPLVFENPDRFDITRENANKHLAFGIGPHVCLGARLAHMQLKALLGEVFTRMPDIRIDGELEWMRSIWFNGILRMPVRFTPEVR